MNPITESEKAASGPLTGHRRGHRPEDPRNSTVCFTTSDREKAAIDALSLCINLRRSAILTEIVVRFMAAVEAPPRGQSKRTALLDFLEDCQDEVNAKRKLFESLTRGK